jgi:hypothetical protein
MHLRLESRERCRDCVVQEYAYEDVRSGRRPGLSLSGVATVQHAPVAGRVPTARLTHLARVVVA